MLKVQRIKVSYKGGPGSGFYGHAGRPEQVGGSTSMGASVIVSMPTIKHTTANMTPEINGIDDVIENNKKLESYLDTANDKMMSFLARNFEEWKARGNRGDLYDVTASSSILKPDIVDAISSKSGIDKPFVVDMMDEFAYSSESAAAKELRKAATSMDLSKPGISKYQKLAKAIYNITQDYLKDIGVDSAILYRGVVVESKRIIDLLKNEWPPVPIKYAMRAIESWTTDYGTAHEFANERWIDIMRGIPIVLAGRFPRSRIFSTSASGIGTLDQREVLTLKTPGTFLALRLHIPTIFTTDEKQVGQKGGPGSGFRGHAGRQRRVGGSTARGTQIISNVAPSMEAAVQFLESQSQVDIARVQLATDDPSEIYIAMDPVPLTNADYTNFALNHMKDVDPAHAAAIIDEMKFFGAAYRDIDGLDEITTHTPAGSVDTGQFFEQQVEHMPIIGDPYKSLRQYAGCYDSNQITLHPSSIRAVLCHELGHHVGVHYGFEDYKRSQLISMLDRLQDAKNFVIQELGLSLNARKNRYELFAEIYDDIKQSLAWIRVDKQKVMLGGIGAKTDYMKHQLDKLRKRMSEHELDDVYDALST